MESSEPTRLHHSSSIAMLDSVVVLREKCTYTTSCLWPHDSGSVPIISWGFSGCLSFSQGVWLQLSVGRLSRQHCLPCSSCIWQCGDKGKVASLSLLSMPLSLSVCLSVCLYLSVSLPLSLSVCLYLSVSLSLSRLYLSVSLCFCLSVCLCPLVCHSLFLSKGRRRWFEQYKKPSNRQQRSRLYLSVVTATPRCPEYYQRS